MIAVGAVALLEYLDNTVKAETDFPELVGAPLLAAIRTVPRIRAGREQLFVAEQRNSPAAEAVRLLRTNLDFAAAAQEIKTLAITSASPQEGKSTVTANLGVAMAQAGFSTVIVDADLRRPSQHRIFDVWNGHGLTSFLTRPDLPWRSAAVETGVANLALIPSGPLPPNPAELLTLDRFRQLLDELIETVDVVLVDTPPVLAASDPLVVAMHTDGVALVCRAGRTRTGALRHAAAALQAGSVRIVGVVLSQQRARAGASYSYAEYYGPSGKEAPQPEPLPAVASAAPRRGRIGAA